MHLPLMLAHNYNESRIQYPVYMQPKLNGIRARYFQGKFYSRDGKQWNDSVVKHILNDLKPYLIQMPGDIMLDGEFYCPDFKNLGDHVSAINVNNIQPSLNTLSVRFWVFDFCRTGNYKTPPFEVRKQILEQNKLPYLVDTFVVLNSTSAEFLYIKWIEAGYEGAIYRSTNLPYIDNRTYKMLKRKKFLEEDFKVVGFTPGKGKCSGMLGALVCETSEGKLFNVGGGFTDSQRKEIWLNQARYISKLATVKFQEYSKDKIPVGNTVFVAFRNYE